MTRDSSDRFALASNRRSSDAARHGLGCSPGSSKARLGDSGVLNEIGFKLDGYYRSRHP